MTTTTPFPIVAFLLMGLITSISSHASTIASFDFDEAAGTPLVGGVTSSAGGYTWSAASGDLAALSTIVTDGSGNLNVVYNSTTLRNPSITLAAEDQITATQNSVVRLDLEVAPWSFSAYSGRSEELRFGFGNSSATNVFAIVHLTRVGSDQVAVQALALGTGATEGTQTVLFGDFSSDPITFVLQVDKIAHKYGLSYRVGSGPLIPVPGNTDLDLSSDRNGNYLRLGFDETFSDDTFAISRFAVTVVPEPATVSLAISALVMGTRRRRACDTV